VAEAGSHEDLIAANGAYAKLVARQLHGGASAASLGGLLSRAQSSGSLSRSGGGNGGGGGGNGGGNGRGGGGYTGSFISSVSERTSIESGPPS
jgi:hypothetical protein